MSQISKRTPRGAFLLMIAAASMGRARPAEPDISERQQRAQVAPFADHVARVFVVDSNEHIWQQGWGLIVGRDDKKLYIATPYHLLHDQVFSPTSHIEIRFRTSPDIKELGQILNTRASSPRDQLDLAVLTVNGAAGGVLSAAPVATLGPDDGGAWVWCIGLQDSWTISPTHGGFIESLAGRQRLSFSNLPTTPGTSGQAVANPSGIVGMITSDGATDETWAVAATQIINQFQVAGLPVNLLSAALVTATNGTPSAAPEFQSSHSSSDTGWIIRSRENNHFYGPAVFSPNGEAIYAPGDVGVLRFNADWPNWRTVTYYSTIFGTTDYVKLSALGVGHDGRLAWVLRQRDLTNEIPSTISTFPKISGIGTHFCVGTILREVSFQQQRRVAG